MWNLTKILLAKVTYYVGFFYTIPFGFILFMALLGITFQLFKLLCLAKDHWRGFGTRNAHMVHIVDYIRDQNGV